MAVARSREVSEQKWVNGVKRYKLPILSQASPRDMISYIAR